MNATLRWTRWSYSRPKMDIIQSNAPMRLYPLQKRESLVTIDQKSDYYPVSYLWLAVLFSLKWLAWQLLSAQTIFPTVDTWATTICQIVDRLRWISSALLRSASRAPLSLAARRYCLRRWCYYSKCWNCHWFGRLPCSPPHRLHSNRSAGKIAGAFQSTFWQTLRVASDRHRNRCSSWWLSELILCSKWPQCPIWIDAEFHRRTVEYHRAAIRLLCNLCSRRALFRRCPGLLWCTHSTGTGICPVCPIGLARRPRIIRGVFSPLANRLAAPTADYLLPISMCSMPCICISWPAEFSGSQWFPVECAHRSRSHRLPFEGITL